MADKSEIKRKASEAARNSPAALMCELETARRRGNWDRANWAVRELAKRGVYVVNGGEGGKG